MHLLTISAEEAIDAQVVKRHKEVFLRVTGHNPPRSESPVQWQGRIKPTESHIADLKVKFQDWRT